MAGSPWYVFLFVQPLLLIGSFYFFTWIWTVKGLISPILSYAIMSQTWSIQASATLNALSVTPIFLLIIIIMLTRVFTSGGNNPLKRQQPLYLAVNANTLNNTLQQTVLFIVNFLGLSSFYSLSIQRMILIFLVFLGSRILYWFFYWVSALTGLQFLKGIFFWFTFLNNLILLAGTVINTYLFLNKY